MFPAGKAAGFLSSYSCPCSCSCPFRVPRFREQEQEQEQEYERTRRDGAKSASFAGQRGDALAEIFADTETGTVAEAIQERENEGDELPFLRLDENPQQARGLQAECDGDGATGDFVNEDVANSATDGERKRGDFPGVEGIIVCDGGRNFRRGDDADEGRKPQASEARLITGESLKLGDDGRRREDCAEEFCQQFVVTKPGEIQDDGGIRDDDHSGKSVFIAARSSSSISGV